MPGNGDAVFKQARQFEAGLTAGDLNLGADGGAEDFRKT